MNKYNNLSTLKADEERAESQLLFIVKCKNTGVVHEYDLSKRWYSEEFKDVVRVISWAMCKRKYQQGHLSRISTLEQISVFCKFLQSRHLYDVDKLTKHVLTDFVAWLKRDSGLSYSSAASTFRTLSPLFIQMSKHPRVGDEFTPPPNSFPKSESYKTGRPGYTREELKVIIRHVVDELREKANKLENKYEPQWLGADPPLIGVAPIDSSTGKRSIWNSEEYKIWWWVNNCDCKQLNSTQLFRMPQGQMFYNSFAGCGSNRIIEIKKFYEKYNEIEKYKNRYSGKECPIKYHTRWSKYDYLVWYWENVVGCKALSIKELTADYPEFLAAISEHYDFTVSEFYESLGVRRWISSHDLVPYYLMLLIRTGLNPSTIQRLTIDCLAEDPLSPGRYMVDWEKYRAHKRGRTIPSAALNDAWVPLIIKRVIAITESFRPEGLSSLWITNANNNKVARQIPYDSMQRTIRQFAERTGIVRDSEAGPISLEGCQFRPTIAWQEYLRTEDLHYLKTLLGHSKIETTAQYLRRTNDPVFLVRRSVHQEAMFLGLTAEVKLGGTLSNNNNFSSVSGDDKHQYADAVMNHCRNPGQSPFGGRQENALCDVPVEACLSCQNLVVTHEDIKKYFCYMTFYEYLLCVGDIAEQEYRNATSDKKHMWETYILPKYDSIIVSRIKREALNNPIPHWDTALYERDKSSSVEGSSIS